MDDIVLRSPADLAGEPDPLKRIEVADELATRARALVGDYSRVRREAIAEVAATAGSNAEAGRLLGIHRNKVGDAVKDVAADDRELFDAALEILVRPGTSGASSTELMRGLAVRDLGPKARRVQFGAKHVTTSALDAAETALVARAARRAVVILGQG